MRSTAEPRSRFFIFNAMKISDMTREQLRDHMMASRLINKYDADTHEWKHAFKLARLSGMENMDMECTGCVKKVKEWLER